MVYQQKGKSAGNRSGGGGYDKSKDIELHSASVEVGECQLSVAVYSYNNGTPKAQINRQVKGEDGNYTFAKLGRLNKEELKAVSKLIAQAYEKM